MPNEIYNIFSTFISIFTLIAAVVLGYLQWKINDRLRQVQDVVAVTFYSTSDNDIGIKNTGTRNIYLEERIMRNTSEKFEQPIQIPPTTGFAFQKAKELCRIPSGGLLPIKIIFSDDLNSRYEVNGIAFKNDDPSESDKIFTRNYKVIKLI